MMNVIEMSKLVDAEGKVSFVNRLSSYLDYGPEWYARIQAQEIATRQLGKTLGDEHILIRNATIPGVDEKLPYMVLIGPQGIRVILSYSTRGVFRAQGSEWLKFHQGSRSFRKDKQNVQTVTINVTQQILRLLEIQGFKRIVTEPVLIFTHPRTLIDSARPTCRVVSIDAIEYFASNIEQLPAIFDSEMVHAIADAILYPQIPEPEVRDGFFNESDDIYEPSAVGSQLEALETDMSGSEHDSQPFEYDLSVEEVASDPFIQTPEASFFEEPLDSPYSQDPFADAMMPVETMPEVESQERSKPRPKMTKKQWFVIISLALVEIIVVIIFAYIVLKDSGFV
jgi:hypothetical protein